MFKVSFDTRAVEAFAKNLKVDLDVQKAVNWYINQVYRDLSKQHGRRYTYVTPPGSKRLNLRKRTGGALRDLKDAKYVTKGQDQWEAGFRIRPGSYLARFHVGEQPGETQVFIARDVPLNQRYEGKVLIPLRAGLNANGTIKPITSRTKVHQQLFKFMRKSDFVGEDLGKFHENSIVIYRKSGRKKIPMYVLAKKFTVPKRMFVRQNMIKYYDDLFDRLDHEITVQLNRQK